LSESGRPDPATVNQVADGDTGAGA